MKTKETFVFSPVEGEDKKQLCELMAEVMSTLFSRTDGIKIEIERNDQFPPLLHNGKSLITGIKLNTWDIAA